MRLPLRLLFLPVIYLLDASTEKQRKTRKLSAIEDAPERQSLICVNCGQIITSNAERISVQSAHEHHCINPAGIEFHIACFSAAPGCISVGAASAEHSWFQGYSWRISVCSNCHQHLGWRFHRSDSFYGLIVDRLRDQQA